MPSTSGVCEPCPSAMEGRCVTRGVTASAPRGLALAPHLFHHVSMGTAIYRTEDPALETVEFGVIYRIHAPRTGDPWTPCKTGDDCGVDSIEPLEVPDGWDDAYEYSKGNMRIWHRLARLAMDDHLANAILEVALVPIVDEEMDTDSYALLYRSIRPD